MDQSTTPKPVMDVMPPKPATPDAQADQSPARDLPKATPPETGTGSGGKEALAVHTAPPLSDEDRASAPEATEPQTAQQKPTAHSGAPKTHGPAGAITFVILAMVVLSALAILVYRNS